MNARLREWAPEAAIGLLVLALGLAEIFDSHRGYAPYAGHRLVLLVVLVLLVAATSLARRTPALALALAWVVGGVHVVFAAPFLFVESAFVVVSFATARWGRWPTVLLGGLSVPGVIALVAVRYLHGLEYDVVPRALDRPEFVDAVHRLGPTAFVGGIAAGLGLLGLPWLAGLVFRYADRARASRASQVVAEDVADRAQRDSELAQRERERAQRDTEQAREIATLREGQARLARDVHDVVGHSLAVILAQAESAQYLPDADTDKLKATMATIATSARSSLRDVREVLAAETDGAAGAAGTATPDPARHGLDALVDGLRSAGHEVVSRELGRPRPLPPDLEVVAHRVLQEMLTNALKHGSRDEPVFVERLWPEGAGAYGAPDELRIEVRNAIGSPDPAGTAPGPGPDAGPIDETQPLGAVPPIPGGGAGGQGLPGMRRRLEAVGGRLDVRRREPSADGPATFTVTVWVPVRTVSP